MQITFDIPEELAIQIGSLEDKLPQILELGLRELNAVSQTGFTGAAEVLEFLAALLIGWMNLVGAFRETPLQSGARLANHA